MNVDSFVNSGMLIRPRRLVLSTPAWIGHIPYAASLVTALRPGTVVELGTHAGNSYLAFCQAIEENGVDAKCYAVDTWLGDEHSETYGEEVFHELKHYHDQHYGSFSTLMRMTFDEASGYFSDGSIDLLHIDGLHTYEAVKHDFDTWYPKLSRNAVVLFHDINVREREFGVWKFWEEVRERHPAIDMMHSHGLGVLFVGEQIAVDCADLPAAWRETRVGRTAEQLFAMLGEAVPTLYLGHSVSAPDASGRDRAGQPSDSSGLACALRASMQAGDRVVAYYRASGEPYSEENAERRDWEPRTNYMSLDFHVDLPQGGFIRLDPSEHGGWFNIIGLNVDGMAVDLGECLRHCNGEIIKTGSALSFSFLETGDDPYVEFEVAASVSGGATSRHSVSLSVAKRGMLEALQSTQAGVDAMLAYGPVATDAIAGRIEASAARIREESQQAIAALAAEGRAAGESALRSRDASLQALVNLVERTQQTAIRAVAEMEEGQSAALETAVGRLTSLSDGTSRLVSELLARNAALEGAVGRLASLSDHTSRLLSELLARNSAMDAALARIHTDMVDGNERQQAAMQEAVRHLERELSHGENQLAASVKLLGSQSQGRQAVLEGLIMELAKTLVSTTERVDSIHTRMQDVQAQRWSVRARRLLGSSREA